MISSPRVSRRFYKDQNKALTHHTVVECAEHNTIGCPATEKQSMSAMFIRQRCDLCTHRRETTPDLSSLTEHSETLLVDESDLATRLPIPDSRYTHMP